MKWNVRRIGDVCEVVPGFAFKSKNLGDDGIPVIKIGNIEDNKSVDISAAQCLPEDLLTERHSKFRLGDGDIVLAMTGATAGKTGRIRCPSDQMLLLNQRVAHLKPVRINPDFLWAAVSTDRYRTLFYSLGGGAAQPNMSGSQIESVEIPYPPTAVQDRIADILSAYDDLIENNRCRIELLEQSARLLYKEWFVHLRFPGHEHTTITNGIPEGWEEKSVAEVCSTFDDGDWIESKDQGGEDYRLLQISNIGDNDFVETGNYRFITEGTFRRLRCNEVVPGDILISRMPKPIGRAWYVQPKPWRMVTAVDATIARPDKTIVHPFYFLHHINSPIHIARCELRATGATRPRVSRKNMGALPILIPPDNLQAMFGEFAEANNHQRHILSQQNEKLAASRDLLLPRLMNGEIPV